jgi:hypothetical protein
LNWRKPLWAASGGELFKLEGATGQKLVLKPGTWVVIRLKNNDLVRATVCSPPKLTTNGYKVQVRWDSITALIDVWQVWAEAEQEQTVKCIDQESFEDLIQQVLAKQIPEEEGN